jgi:hypothetical protein
MAFLVCVNEFYRVVIVVVIVVVWAYQAVLHNRNDYDHDNDNRPASAGLTTTSGISKNRFSNRQLRRLNFSSQTSTFVGWQRTGF